jgi:hypothetical protein
MYLDGFIADQNIIETEASKVKTQHQQIIIRGLNRRIEWATETLTRFAAAFVEHEPVEHRVRLHDNSDGKYCVLIFSPELPIAIFCDLMLWLSKADTFVPYGQMKHNGHNYTLVIDDIDPDCIIGHGISSKISICVPTGEITPMAIQLPIGLISHATMSHLSAPDEEIMVSISRQTHY